MIPEELEDLLERLFDYFELGKDEWPWVQVHTSEGPTMGVIDDELHNILIEMHEEYYNYTEENIE